MSAPEFVGSGIDSPLRKLARRSNACPMCAFASLAFPSRRHMSSKVSHD